MYGKDIINLGSGCGSMVVLYFPAVGISERLDCESDI
jgi:hypothetical protein